MVHKEITLNMPSGITPKHLSLIAMRASMFRSEISLEIGTIKANAKSLMGLLSLNLKHEQKIVVEVRGVDEEDAINEMQRTLTFFI